MANRACAAPRTCPQNIVSELLNELTNTDFKQATHM